VSPFLLRITVQSWSAQNAVLLWLYEPAQNAVSFRIVEPEKTSVSPLYIGANSLAGQKTPAC